MKNQGPWSHSDDIITREKKLIHKGHIIPRDKCSEKNKAGERATKGRPEA